MVCDNDLTQPENCEKTKALGAIDRIKEHNSLYPYVSTPVTQCIPRRSLLQCENTLRPLIYVHNRHIQISTL